MNSSIQVRVFTDIEEVVLRWWWWIVDNKGKVKVKQSRYRPGVAQGGSRKLRFPDFLTTAQEGGKVVSHTHRPHLPPGNSGTHFC
jgi:hypothetical protein